MKLWRRSPWILLLAPVAILAVGTAQAAPITYNFVTGSASLIVQKSGGAILATPTLDFDGAFAEFDAATVQLTDLSFTLTPGQMFTLSSPYGGFDQITVDMAELKPALGYAPTTGTGTNPYFGVGGGPMEVVAEYMASFSGGPPPLPAMAPVTVPIPSLTGQVTLGAMATFEISGVTLGILPAASFPGETEDLIILANVVWDGQAEPVPEPTVVGLLSLACGFLLLRRL